MKEKIEKLEQIVKKIVSCRIIYYIIIMLIFLASYYIDFRKRVEEAGFIENSNHLKYFLIVSAITAIITFILIVFSKKLYEKIKPHFVYFILALIIGGMYIFIIPLGAQSDEPTHIYRVFRNSTRRNNFT